MNVYSIMNVLMVQRRRRYVNIQMDVIAIVNVVTIQQRMCYANVTMYVYFVMTALMVQLGTSCSFENPGLVRNEPTPGKHSQGDSTPSVLSFFYEGTLIMKPFMAD